MFETDIRRFALALGFLPANAPVSRRSDTAPEFRAERPTSSPRDRAHAPKLAEPELAAEG